MKTYRTEHYFIRIAETALEKFEEKLQTLKAKQKAHIEKFVDYWLIQKIRLIRLEDGNKVPILPPKGQYEKDTEKFKKKIFSYLIAELRKQKKLTE